MRRIEIGNVVIMPLADLRRMEHEMDRLAHIVVVAGLTEKKISELVGEQKKKILELDHEIDRLARVVREQEDTIGKLRANNRKGNLHSSAAVAALRPDAIVFDTVSEKRGIIEYTVIVPVHDSAVLSLAEKEGGEE